MTENETIIDSQRKLFRLSQLLEQGVITLDDIADFVPGIMHINKRENLEMTYLSKTGCDFIGYSLEEIRTDGLKILQRHQSNYTIENTFPRLMQKLAEDDKDLIVPFFQDWKVKKNDKPFFYLTSTKILNDDEFISVSLLPERLADLSQKVNDIFETNRVFEKYFTRFNNLTKREKEILKMLGKELARKEIAFLLYIDEKTVKKHCEHIFKKMGTSKRIELDKIARAFTIII